MGNSAPLNMKRARIPTRLNGFLFLIFFLSQIFLLGVFPLAYHRAPTFAAVGLALSVILVLPTWYLIHEAVHDHLAQNVKIGGWMGRTLGVLSGVPFTGIRVAHLLHHRWNRIEEFAEIFDPKETSWLSANIKYYFLILGGLYWVELLGGIVTYLPNSLRLPLADKLAGTNSYMKRVYRGMNQPKNLLRIRNESTLIVLIYLASFYLYGREMLGLLLVVLSMRALLISLFDNSFHYEASRNLGDNAAGTRNHSLAASWFVLNFNYHSTHHRHPGVPWIDLPKLALNEGARFEGGYFYWAVRQFRGAVPIRDEFARPVAVAKTRGLNFLPVPLPIPLREPNASYQENMRG